MAAVVTIGGVRGRLVVRSVLLIALATCSSCSDRDAERVVYRTCVDYLNNDVPDDITPEAVDRVSERRLDLASELAVSATGDLQESADLYVRLKSGVETDDAKGTKIQEAIGGLVDGCREVIDRGD